MAGARTMLFLIHILHVYVAASESTMVMEKLENIETLLMSVDKRLRNLELLHSQDDPRTQVTIDRTMTETDKNRHSLIDCIHLHRYESERKRNDMNKSFKSDEIDITTAWKHRFMNVPNRHERPNRHGRRVRRHVEDTSKLPKSSNNDTTNTGTMGDGAVPVSSIETRLNQLTQHVSGIQNTTTEQLQRVERVLKDVVYNTDYLKRETHDLYHKVDDVSKCETSFQFDQVLEELQHLQTQSTTIVENISELNRTLTENMDAVKPEHYTSCVDVMSKHQTNGVYLIDVGGIRKLIYCDQETDSGGWIVFQRRVDGSENFNRQWLDYKEGFGNISKEFWLGNDWISFITNHAPCELRIDMVSLIGKSMLAKYDNFRVLPEEDNYRLELGVYTGDTEQNLTYHNGMNFSTSDRDNDYHPLGSCAQQWEAGWWYKDCFSAHLNGVYSTQFIPENNFMGRMRWGYHLLEKVEMKVRCLRHIPS